MTARPKGTPRRVLMTVDAVGGVWRYAIDLAAALNRQGIGCLLVGSGPRLGSALAFGRLALPDTELVWTDMPLDWLITDEALLDAAPDMLAGLARDRGCDLLHLNLPSQAAGIAGHLPVVVVSHSCVPTWWDCMRDTPLPHEWAWQRRRNREGLDRADAVLAPSGSHAAALVRVYGPRPNLSVVHNATSAVPSIDAKEPFVLAAGRWWDEGKNAAILDRAAQSAPWPVWMAGPLEGPNGQKISVAHAQAPGELPAAAMDGLMRRAAIFAAPSRYEPFGLAVLEAATHHTALVLSDIPTFRELWDDAALFVAPDDAPGFTHAITRLAQDAELRERLASRATSIAGRFTPARQLEGICAAYAGAMTRRHHTMREVG